MSTVLITGANRGIGLGFVHHYGQAGWRVLACCRHPEQAHELRAIASQASNVEVFALDVADHDQIDHLAAQLKQERIDVLINNAGLYGDEKGRGFGHLDYQCWMDVFRVNVQGPVKMSEAFLPHILRGRRKLIVAITSKMGSIADNTSGGSILYRSSKAALNAAMRSVAIDLRNQGVGVLLLHPGWVRTEMGGPNALISVEESVAGMARLIGNFDLRDSGEFFDYLGRTVPW